jgi:hypothetical protein
MRHFSRLERRCGAVLASTTRRHVASGGSADTSTATPSLTTCSWCGEQCGDPSALAHHIVAQHVRRWHSRGHLHSPNLDTKPPSRRKPCESWYLTGTEQVANVSQETCDLAAEALVAFASSKAGNALPFLLAPVSSKTATSSATPRTLAIMLDLQCGTGGRPFGKTASGASSIAAMLAALTKVQREGLCDTTWIFACGLDAYAMQPLREQYLAWRETELKDCQGDEGSLPQLPGFFLLPGGTSDNLVYVLATCNGMLKVGAARADLRIFSASPMSATPPDHAVRPMETLFSSHLLGAGAGERDLIVHSSSDELKFVHFPYALEYDGVHDGRHDTECPISAEMRRQTLNAAIEHGLRFLLRDR